MRISPLSIRVANKAHKSFPSFRTTGFRFAVILERGEGSVCSVNKLRKSHSPPRITTKMASGFRLMPLGRFAIAGYAVGLRFLRVISRTARASAPMPPNTNG